MFRKATSGAKKGRWIGTNGTRGSEASSRRCTHSRYAAWRVVARFTAAIRVPRSRLFSEAQEHGFEFFGGVFRRMRYDNLPLAVRKILREYQRKQTERFVEFRSHWGFESDFCNPSRGNEKGGVEGEVGYFRRNHLTPVPEFSSWDELNEHLLSCCHKDATRHISGKEHSVGTAMQLEVEHLLPMAVEGYEIEERSFPKVNKKGCVRVGTNWYSTPLERDRRVMAKLLPLEVEIWH